MLTARGQACDEDEDGFEDDDDDELETSPLTNV
jgi:hypothetical protein